MKKVYLSALLAFSVMGSAAFAQQSVKGFPQSMDIASVEAQEVAHITFDRPDYEAIIKEDKARELSGMPGPYMVSTFVPSDINLLNSGTWSYLDDGSKIWRLSLTVPDAKGIALLYDQFHLPEGVRLFISNGNGRQVLGAYTAINNDPEFGNFAHQPVQGQTVNLEMDVPAEVSVQDIVFHIDKVSAFYRSVSYLNRMYGDAGTITPAKPTDIFDGGSSASCNIDANCEISSPLVHDDYEIPKKASIRIIVIGQNGQGLCSGTLINNTGNGKNNTCIPYVLTASHCDGSNSYSSSNFSQWLFNFNFRYDSCGGGNIEGGSMSSVLTGADFRARSNVPSMGAPGGEKLSLVGDFLLLELKIKPNSYGVYYAGWNRNTDIAFDQSYDFFIGYHYPAGDVEKLSWGTSIQSNGVFNQSQVHSTHWRINFAEGGTQGGSSGSGLFDVNGRLIGDLSGGTPEGCPPGQGDFGREGLYSKLSYDWDNEYDQTNHSSHAGPESRLKDWLDPINSGAKTLDPMKPDCSPAGIQQVSSDELGNSIKVYPSPSTTGMIQVQTNLTDPTDLTIRVYNSLGRMVKAFTLNNAYQGAYRVDCSDLANGIYMMQFSGAHATTAKKVLIAR